MSEAVLIRVVARLVEVIHVQLSHKRREVIVLEEFGEDAFSEIIRLSHDEAIAVLVPADDTVKLRVLKRMMIVVNTYVDDVVGFDQERRHVEEGGVLLSLYLLGRSGLREWCLLSLLFMFHF